MYFYTRHLHGGRMVRFRIQNLMIFLVMAAPTWSGCGNSKPSSAPLDNGGADAVGTTFQFDEKTESKIDQSALYNSATEAGHSIVTLYFEGGLTKNCANWDFTLKGDDLKLAEGKKLNAEHQKLFKQEKLGVISGKFTTHGGLEGLRVVALAGTKLRLSGLQDFCLSKDATEFDVKIDVKLTKKPARLFTGVESAGQTAVRYRVSDEKEDVETSGEATDTSASASLD